MRQKPGSAVLTAAEVARLATFPEQNPNLVIETTVDGTVTYLNRPASSRFPDLLEKGTDHPLLSHLPDIIDGFGDGDEEYRSHEVTIDDAVFEQKICLTRVDDQAFVRIYAHDVTAMHEAERAIQELARRVVHIQEEERRRISRELHDDAGQALTALKIGLELLHSDTELDADALHENLADAVSLVDETQERIRRMAQGLRPPALDTIGLTATLEDLCATFGRRTRLGIEFRSTPLPALDDDTRICLYRLLQEALTNCAVHAEAAHVTVEMVTSNGHVTLDISDDGKGMDPSLLETTHSSGLGLLGIRERIELLTGRLDIETAPGRGMRLVATLPIGEPS